MPPVPVSRSRERVPPPTGPRKSTWLPRGTQARRSGIASQPTMADGRWDEVPPVDRPWTAVAASRVVAAAATPSGTYRTNPCNGTALRGPRAVQSDCARPGRKRRDGRSPSRRRHHKTPRSRRCRPPGSETLAHLPPPLPLPRPMASPTAAIRAAGCLGFRLRRPRRHDARGCRRASQVTGGKRQRTSRGSRTGATCGAGGAGCVCCSGGRPCRL